MALLRAYVDESGIDAASTEFAFAGWVGPTDEWERVAPKWSEALASAGLAPGRPFHMTDCEGGHGQLCVSDRFQVALHCLPVDFGKSIRLGNMNGKRILTVGRWYGVLEKQPIGLAKLIDVLRHHNNL
jgi:hypothetical protein